MKINDISCLLDRWAPPGIAWERDNPGLQVGDPTARLMGILLAFDITPEVLSYALEKKLNLIITHHPLLFHPLRKLNTSAHGIPALVKTALVNNLAVYSYHTNLDYARGGVSFSLAEMIGLHNIRFLEPAPSKRNKLVVFVPKGSLQKVSDSVFNAGGGIIGSYSECSFFSEGTGTFRGDEGSNPAIGMKGNFENVEEVRLEIIFNEWDRTKIINALLASHPYEQPAFDIYKLENSHENFGAGAIGELPEETDTREFLKVISKALHTPCLRHSAIKKDKVKKIAVCGGAGEEYAQKAAACGADVFVTADIRYHNYLDAGSNMMLIDAGHFETESHILIQVKKEILKHSGTAEIPIEIFPRNANPVFYYTYKE